MQRPSNRNGKPVRVVPADTFRPSERTDLMWLLIAGFAYISYLPIRDLLVTELGINDPEWPDDAA
jgi:hypothetical protein